MAPRPRAGRLGFVPVRFGDDLVGGAEMLVAEMADGLALRGWDVDVLTGCTRDHFREVGHYPPGASTRPSGVRVVRFPSVASWHRADRVLGNRALDAGAQLAIDEQIRWCNDDVRVPALFDHLLDHGGEYRALVFAPYLYWTTVVGSLAAPERSVLLPCLHDEPAARLAVVARPFGAVRGCWFLSEPEAELARLRYPDLAEHVVIGSAVAEPGGYEPRRFRDRYGITGPFALYLGRRESGKAFSRLLDDYVGAVEHETLGMPLVVAGPGKATIARGAREHVVDVGLLDARSRDDALAAATAVIQPSPYESFSRTMMEAWLAGAFVVVHGESRVGAWHVERAGAGVTYRGPAELGAALRTALAPGARDDGARGREYVRREYTWPAVLDRVEAALDRWFPVPA